MEVEAGHDARAARAADRRRHERVLEGGALVHQQRLRLVQSLQQAACWNGIAIGIIYEMNVGSFSYQ